MVRLLNPLGSLASTVGVFHPAYRDLHRDAAKLLGWRNLAVVKGGGGEFELNPLKTTSVHRIVAGESRDHAMAELIADTRGRPTRGTLDELVAVWNGHRRDAAAEAIVIATAAVALATVSESDPAQHVREAQDLGPNAAPISGSLPLAFKSGRSVHLPVRRRRWRAAWPGLRSPRICGPSGPAPHFL